MKVTIHLQYQSQPLIYSDVKNCYQKGSLYCVLLEDESIHKFPINNIFRIIEK